MEISPIIIFCFFLVFVFLYATKIHCQSKYTGIRNSLSEIELFEYQNNNMADSKNVISNI